MASWVKTIRGSEAFWCRVEGMFGNAAVLAVIDNDLVEDTRLKRGQTIVIRHADIVDCMSLPERSLEDPFELR